jgi:Flp pilus assembly protein CpaB
MRTNKNTSKIILAVTVAILATMISYSAFSNMRNQMQEQQKLIDVMQKTQKDSTSETYAYAVATVDLKAGEIVSDSDVDFKQFDSENKEAFQNRSDVINKVLLKDISIGEEFTTTQIALISNDEVTLREGYRALTLPADNFQGKSETMKQGSSVDIYSTVDDGGWVLEGVRIISFESPKTGTTNSTSSIIDASSITFEVSASDISSFISNISKGKLMLVTRNPNDKPAVHKKTRASYGSYSAKYSSLPNLPSAVPITNFGSHGKNFSPDNFSQLPLPVKPAVQSPSVEVIEANVKSKVTFE